MSLMEEVIYQEHELPLLLLIYGVDGIGKTTFALRFPKPIFMGPEKGIPREFRRGPNKVPALKKPETFKQLVGQLDKLLAEEHEFRTLVIDSLDWIEPLLWDQLCDDNHWKNIEDPGYGKGFTIALKTWSDMIHRVNRLREERGMNVILIAHYQAKNAKDPQNQTEYDRYQLKLNDKAAALWREFVDAVLFANYEVLTHKEKGKVRAMGDGARFLYTERRPGFDAKNRFGLPFQIPLDFDAFMEAYQAGEPEDPAVVQQNVRELAEMIEDETIRKKTFELVKKAGNDIAALQGLQNRLRGYVGAK